MLPLQRELDLEGPGDHEIEFFGYVLRRCEKKVRRECRLSIFIDLRGPGGDHWLPKRLLNALLHGGSGGS